MNAKDKSLTEGMNEAQRSLIAQKTPKEYVKKRLGRGGIMLDYVETGYVISQLNQLFNFLWDFEILDHGFIENQIWVKGKLTAKLNEKLTIIKTQYGGSVIKKSRDGNIISIADDLKAAASDSLKKCASLVGIASDIYWQGEKEDDTETFETAEKIFSQKLSTRDIQNVPMQQMTECPFCGTVGKYHRKDCPLFKTS